ncbi:MAG: rRNA pseudouridine synthase [Bacilli bacterium]|jgi:16S rRNA pseudouridine516 synthase|nr:rRNA pseudouridine synthase [Bacilli bacterium]
MRLDRFLSNSGYGSRRASKKVLRNFSVKVNGVVVSDYAMQIKGTDKIEVDGKVIPNLPYVTMIINKPSGYMCSMKDENYPSVMNLIPEEYRKRVRMVGRLDQDTTGLLILTDNGVLNARLAHPKHQVEKTYLAKVNHILRPTLVDLFNQEIDIGRGEIAKPAKLEIIDEYHAYVTVHEGKYHEIKRLFGHFSYDVVELKRVSFGTITLGDLKEGEIRLLSEEEYESLLQITGMKRIEQL